MECKFIDVCDRKEDCFDCSEFLNHLLTLYKG